MHASCSCPFAFEYASESAFLLWYRIEGGYRAYHATVLSLLRQHPGSIVSANAGYRQQLCSHLCVEASSSMTQPASSTSGADAAVAQVSGDADPGIFPLQGGSVAAGGVEFKARLDIYMQCVAQPVAAAVATAEQTAADAAKAVGKAKADAAAAVVKAATDAAAEEAKLNKGGKDAKGKPASAAKPKEASVADKSKRTEKGGKPDKTAAEAAAAEPPQPEFEFEFEGVKAPMDRSGAVLCHEDAVPESALRHVLQTLQKQFLEDMVVFCEEAESGGHSWAGEEEVAATEQLEARLRSHRYSCGAIVHPA